jgi:hypothetical protein
VAIGQQFELLYFRTVKGEIAPDIRARMRRRDSALLNDPTAREVVATPRVIGVVEDIRAFGLDVGGDPAFYLSYRQAPPRWNARYSQMFAVRATSDPASLLKGVRAAVESVTPTVRVNTMESMSELVARSIGGRGSTRLMMLVSALFGALALALTMSGLFGIVLHTVNQRLPEIGVRMALGADRGDVARLLLAYAGRIILGGVALGATAAWAISGTLRSLVFGVSPTDPATYVGSMTLLIACVLLACVMPIRRALQCDPTRLLRN